MTRRLLRPRTLPLALLLAASLALPVALEARSARACGGFFMSESEAETQVVDSTDQRVLFVVEGNRVRQYVQVEYSRQVTQLAWVYPVAGLPTVSEGDATVFDRADEQSRPRFTITTHYPASEPSGPAIGCGGAMDASGRGGPDDHTVDDVQVWAAGQVGAFDYVVLSADSVDPLVEWLTTNGFAIPDEANPIMAHYVAGGWYFVAMRVSADQPAATETSTTTVVFDYTTDRPTFPLHMASLSSAENAGILVYVLSTSAYGTEGLPTRTIDDDRLEATGPESTNYDALFTEAVGEAGNAGFVREAAVEGESLMQVAAGDLMESGHDYVLTRLRTRLSTLDMDEDVRLVPATATVSSGAPSYQLDYYSRTSEPYWEEDDGYVRLGRDTRGRTALAGLFVAVLFTFRRLRRG